MTDATPRTPGIHAARLPEDVLKDNFSDLHPRLDPHEATVAADRCYFCHDAPCITACPTDIDIPLFIRQIGTGMPEAAAETILSQNILGGMCARVCPTETLCEQACVRETAEGKPVLIGQLQRYATDVVMEKGLHPFARAQATGKKVAVVGAGPSGLACAHRLAMKGHDVVIFEAKPKPGGLNEYGIATYKTVDDFAAREVAWLCQIGGISLEYGRALGGDITLGALRADYDAVFLGVGLGGTNGVALTGAPKAGVEDAVAFIEALRQAESWGAHPVGRHVVVIGGGMTAVDAAVQAKLLGAETVTLAYRGPRERMKASDYEVELAASKGVHLLTGATPVGVEGNGSLTGVRFVYTGSEDSFVVPADQCLLAIGQVLKGEGMPAQDGGKIAVDAAGRTSVAGVWAGGDCAAGGDDLTVTAVAEGRDAAEDIHATLSAAS